MKRKRKKIFIVLLAIVIPLIIVVGIYYLTKKAEDENGLSFYLPRSNSFASNWNYELSDNSILTETDAGHFDYLHCEYEYWKFEPIESGEVTIYFIAQYQTEEVTEDSFSITYYVDENYQITEISSNNKPEKINFDDDVIGYIDLIIYNLICTRIKLVISFFMTFL